MEVATRRRGRPKGSKNKRKAMSADLIAQQCDQQDHNPVQFLIDVAQGIDTSQEWTKDDIWKSNAKLVDLIHNNKKLHEELGDAINGQYEIVFETGEAGFQLPGASSPALIEGIHGQAPVQRIGVSPEDGQDSIRD
eukprot:COSAG01_NODE_6702_length_3546_cov_3.445899_7_plen_136_part_00